MPSFEFRCHGWWFGACLCGFHLLTCSVLVSVVGPFSHQSFGCLVLGLPTIDECLSTPAHLHFLMGAASPDAVKGIAPMMHSLEYSGMCGTSPLCVEET